MVKLRNFVVVASVFGAVFTWAAPAVADTTIGDTGSNNNSCIGDFTLIQTNVASAPGVSYVVPSGNWVVTSWTVVTGTSGGQAALVVAQSLGGGQYKIVGSSATESLSANATNTFSTSISVQAGDVTGLWVSPGANCAVSTSNSSDELDRLDSSTAPTAGATMTRAFAATNYLVDLSATLSPAVSPTETPDSMFLCYSKWEEDGGAVFQTDQAEQLLVSGWWLPTAVPGDVDGGDNLGAYHLECNPPDGLTATGTYVDDGGNVLDPNAAGFGSYAIKTGS